MMQLVQAIRILRSAGKTGGSPACAARVRIRAVAGAKLRCIVTRVRRMGDHP